MQLPSVPHWLERRSALRDPSARSPKGPGEHIPDGIPVLTIA
jgi:hypothetical protein